VYQKIDKMTLGGKVKRYRDVKNLSQTKLAEMVQVSQSMIASLEADKNIPNAHVLYRIAEVLDVDINELLSEDHIIQNNSGKAIGHIQSQVTINNQFPEDVLKILMSNQEKITNLLESQNKLMEEMLKQRSK